MNDETPLQHVDGFHIPSKVECSLSVFPYLNLHPFFTACLQVKWKQEESDGQAIHAFHAKKGERRTFISAS